MVLEQRLAVTRGPDVDLEERVRLIVELWGEGEALDEEKIVMVAGNLYGVGPEEVREAIFANLRKGLIRGRFYVLDGPPSRE